MTQAAPALSADGAASPQPRTRLLPVPGLRRRVAELVLRRRDRTIDRSAARGCKIAFDWLAAAASLIVIAPVLCAIAVLVRLDGGPALFGHLRIGQNGRPFHCLKFRTMVTNSEAALSCLLRDDPLAAAEWAETHKLRRDPRITPIGRFLRASSLDELPQLFNILRLEMSLVGPRPIVAAEVPRYGDKIAAYHSIRPGLTGLWQISGRSGTTYDERVQLDTRYAHNWSFWSDMRIILRTVPAVLRSRGAC
jgi:undecaprenyl-phosphate galactose phosphotransferase